MGTLKDLGGVIATKKYVDDEIANIPIPPAPEPQQQSDWNETDTSKPDYIKNKPTIPDTSTLANKDLSNLSATGDVHFGKVKTVNDISPDANGNIDITTGGGGTSSYLPKSVMGKVLMWSDDYGFSYLAFSKALYMYAYKYDFNAGLGTYTTVVGSEGTNQYSEIMPGLSMFYFGGFQNYLNDHQAFVVSTSPSSSEISDENIVAWCDLAELVKGETTWNNLAERPFSELGYSLYNSDSTGLEVKIADSETNLTIQQGTNTTQAINGDQFSVTDYEVVGQWNEPTATTNGRSYYTLPTLSGLSTGNVISAVIQGFNVNGDNVINIYKDFYADYGKGEEILLTEQPLAKIIVSFRQAESDTITVGASQYTYYANDGGLKLNLSGKTITGTMDGSGETFTATIN